MGVAGKYEFYTQKAGKASCSAKRKIDGTHRRHRYRWRRQRLKKGKIYKHVKRNYHAKQKIRRDSRNITKKSLCLWDTPIFKGFFAFVDIVHWLVFSCRFTSQVSSATIQTPAALKRKKAMLYKAVYLVRLGWLLRKSNACRYNSLLPLWAKLHGKRRLCPLHLAWKHSDLLCCNASYWNQIAAACKTTQTAPSENPLPLQKQIVL